MGGSARRRYKRRRGIGGGGGNGEGGVKQPGKAKMAEIWRRRLAVSRQRWRLAFMPVARLTALSACSERRDGLLPVSCRRIICYHAANQRATHLRRLKRTFHARGAFPA